MQVISGAQTKWVQYVHRDMVFCSNRFSHIRNFGTINLFKIVSMWGNKSLCQSGSWAYLMRLRGEKAVLFDLDGPQPPFGWELFKSLHVRGGGGRPHNLFCSHQILGSVQVLEGWQIASTHLSGANEPLKSALVLGSGSSIPDGDGGGGGGGVKSAPSLILGGWTSSSTGESTSSAVPPLMMDEIRDHWRSECWWCTGSGRLTEEESHRMMGACGAGHLQCL